MAYTIEEEQEINQFKSWWKENYKGIIIVFVLTLAAVYGWRYWQTSQVAKAQNQSVAYEMLLNSTQGKMAADAKPTEMFVSENSGSSYAVFALLAQAKAEVQAFKFKQAEVSLESALAQTTDPVLQAVAALRLSAVQLQLKKYNAALASLQKINDQSWAASKLLLQGEIEQAQGKTEQAKATLQQALSIADPESKPLIQVRLNSL